ncbi:MAG: hypothetical protein OXF73_04135 [Gammaproteobacteria bacterium]|nr:hypothetical protein [Gammaproteobacteria bacterium]MCY4226190.1 hypothetical protein [Gammaproteobacteria bacterium]
MTTKAKFTKNQPSYRATYQDVLDAHPQKTAQTIDGILHMNPLLLNA